MDIFNTEFVMDRYLDTAIYSSKRYLRQFRDNNTEWRDEISTSYLRYLINRQIELAAERSDRDILQLVFRVDRVLEQLFSVHRDAQMRYVLFPSILHTIPDLVRLNNNKQLYFIRRIFYDTLRIIDESNLVLRMKKMAVEYSREMRLYAEYTITSSVTAHSDQLTVTEQLRMYIGGLIHDDLEIFIHKSLNELIDHPYIADIIIASEVDISHNIGARCDILYLRWMEDHYRPFLVVDIKTHISIFKNGDSYTLSGNDYNGINSLNTTQLDNYTELLIKKYRKHRNIQYIITVGSAVININAMEYSKEDIRYVIENIAVDRMIIHNDFDEFEYNNIIGVLDNKMDTIRDVYQKGMRIYDISGTLSNNDSQIMGLSVELEDTGSVELEDAEFIYGVDILNYQNIYPQLLEEFKVTRLICDYNIPVSISAMTLQLPSSVSRKYMQSMNTPRVGLVVNEYTRVQMNRIKRICRSTVRYIASSVDFNNSKLGRKYRLEYRYYKRVKRYNSDGLDKLLVELYAVEDLHQMRMIVDTHSDITHLMPIDEEYYRINMNRMDFDDAHTYIILICMYYTEVLHDFHEYHIPIVYRLLYPHIIAALNDRSNHRSFPDIIPSIAGIISIRYESITEVLYGAYFISAENMVLRFDNFSGYLIRDNGLRVMKRSSISDIRVRQEHPCMIIRYRDQHYYYDGRLYHLRYSVNNGRISYFEINDTDTELELPPLREYSISDIIHEEIENNKVISVYPSLRYFGNNIRLQFDHNDGRYTEYFRSVSELVDTLRSCSIILEYICEFNPYMIDYGNVPILRQYVINRKRSVDIDMMDLELDVQYIDIHIIHRECNQHSDCFDIAEHHNVIDAQLSRVRYNYYTGRELLLMFRSDMVYYNDNMYRLQFSMDMDDLVMHEDKYILMIKRELSGNYKLRQIEQGYHDQREIGTIMDRNNLIYGVSIPRIHTFMNKYIYCEISDDSCRTYDNQERFIEQLQYLDNYEKLELDKYRKRIHEHRIQCIHCSDVVIYSLSSLSVRHSNTQEIDNNTVEYFTPELHIKHRGNNQLIKIHEMSYDDMIRWLDDLLLDTDGIQEYVTELLQFDRDMLIDDIMRIRERINRIQGIFVEIE